MVQLTSSASTLSLAALSKLPEDLQAEAMRWESALSPIVAGPKAKRGLHLELVAKRFGVKPRTAREKFDRYRKNGLAGLIDRRAAGSDFWQIEDRVGLSIADQETLKTFCESNQRGNEAAIREMRRQWKLGNVRTDTEFDPGTGYPYGWSERNLARYAPDELELAAARQGRSATDAHRSLVYTTRRDLYVGQYYLFDDLWHDHYCNLLATRQSGRPLEFHGLDLASGYKMCWGMRLRREVGGKMEQLKVEDFRFLLASFLFSHGYHPNGTTLIVEHGTTAIDERTEKLLAIATNGAIKVQRGGMVGAAAHAGQYAGRAKGNFRIKAALESLGNLIHNECGFLPGQTGKDRQHAPEQLHNGGPRFRADGTMLRGGGQIWHNDSLLKALSEISPERAQWIQWEFCTLQQFQLFAQELYARINSRTNHRLEGWDERYIPDRHSGKMRRMSPAEVWAPGSRALRPIAPHVAAMIVGTEGGKERPVRKGEIAIEAAEISGDPIRYSAAHLPPRAKYLCVLNPFDTKRLTLFNAKGGYVTTLDRIDVPCRSDVEAVQASAGRAERELTQRLIPMRRRAMKKAREKEARHLNNDRVLDTSRPFTEDEKLADRERIAQTVPLTAFVAEDGSDPYAADVVVDAVPTYIVEDSFAPNDDSGDVASMEDFL